LEQCVRIEFLNSDYIAPEIFTDYSEGYDYRCDTYSLGAIIHFMLTKKEVKLYLCSIKNEFNQIQESLKGKHSSNLIDLMINLLNLNPNERHSVKKIISMFEDDSKKNQAKMEIELDQKINIEQFISTENIEPVTEEYSYLNQPEIETNFRDVIYNASLVCNCVDKNIIRDAVKFDGNLIKFADSSFQNDREIIMEAVKNNGKALEFASKELRNDKVIATEALKQNRWAIEFISNELKNDQEVMLEGIKQNGRIMKHASDQLKDNKEFIKKAIHLDIWCFEYASKNIKNDKEIVMEVIEINPSMIRFISDDLKKDREIVKLTLKRNEKMINFVHDLRDDEEYMLELVQENPRILLHTKFRSNFDFILKAIQLNELSFNYISTKLQKDRSLILKSIENNGYLLAYLPAEYQNDFEIVFTAMKKNFHSLQFSSLEIRNNEEFALKFIYENGDALQYLSDELKDNENIVSAAIESNPESWIHASNRIQYLGSSNSYEIIKKIAEGGEGIISKIKYKSGFFAEKKICIDHLNQLNYLFDGFKIVKQLKHENIYEIFEIIQDHNVITDVCMLKLIMKLYDGNLMELIRNEFPKGIPESLLIDFAIQITTGLDFIHESHILHCDLKPENIFYQYLDDKINLVLGDFGYNKLEHFSSKMMGSLMYIAPEIIDEVNHTEASDCFGLGGIFYQMMNNEERMLYVDCLKGTLNVNNSKYSSSLNHLVQNLLSLDPKKRFNTKEILKVLKQIKDD
jgi:serine/threonine protein kinase